MEVRVDFQAATFEIRHGRSGIGSTNISKSVRFLLKIIILSMLCTYLSSEAGPLRPAEPKG
jgi:hypothetical protein